MAYVASISRQFRGPIYWNAHASSSFDHEHWGYNSVFKQIRRCSVDGRKRYENDKCGRKSFWKRSKTAPVSFENGLVWTGLIDSWLIGGPLGQALCKLVVFVSDLSAAVSIQSLVLIAVDRFGAVILPLLSPLISSRLCPFFILATWIVAIAVNSPELFALRLVEYPGKLVCERYWNELFGESSSFENYLLSYKVVFNFIPLVLIAIFYIVIYLKLKSQRIPGEQSSNAGQQRQQRERNVLKMVIAIVLGFAVCWLPSAIFSFILVLTDIVLWPNCGVPYYLHVFYFMAIANSAVNPCICFIFSRKYRRELKALLK